MSKLALDPPMPHAVRAFGLASALGLGIAVSFATGPPTGFTIGLLWGAVGLASPPLLRWIYRAWNYAVRRFARLLAFAAAAAGFLCVVTLVRLTGSSLRLHKRSLLEPRWERRAQVGTAPDSSRFLGNRGALSRRENWWAVCLVPFAALATLGDPPANAPAEGIYTLF